MGFNLDDCKPVTARGQRLADYRIEPGLYRVGPLTIIRGGHDHWQLRDEFGDIVDIYRTCRAAIATAIMWHPSMEEVR